MIIGAVQKTTLLDYPGKVACTVFLPGCNLRCPFCHNPGLVLPGAFRGGVSEEALFAFLQKRRGILDGVCITGGEPTVHPDLPGLIRKIRDLGYLVKLDTNGSHPAMLRRLTEEGLLDFVAMDIKNSPEKYALTCGGIDILPAVRESAALLMGGQTEYEFRTTVCSLHTEADLRSIGAWLHGDSPYYLQNFVDSGSLVGTGISALSDGQIRSLLRAVLPDLPNARIRGL